MSSIQPGGIIRRRIEQTEAVKESLDFCSIKETFLKIFIFAHCLPRWVIFTGVTFWVLDTSMQSRVLFLPFMAVSYTLGTVSALWEYFLCVGREREALYEISASDGKVPPPPRV